MIGYAKSYLIGLLKLCFKPKINGFPCIFIKYLKTQKKTQNQTNNNANELIYAS